MKRRALPADSPDGENVSPAGTTTESASTSAADDSTDDSSAASSTAVATSTLSRPALAAPTEVLRLATSIGPDRPPDPGEAPAACASLDDRSARLFDLIVVVDWSASSTPRTGRDSIWTDTFDPLSTTHDTRNHRTRHLAAAHLLDVVRAGTGGAVLIGFDFPFGYPCGFAAAAGLRGDPAWRATWDHLAAELTDHDDNRNDRFALASALNRAVSAGPGPFWGTGSTRSATEWLRPTKAPGFPHPHRAGALPEMRRTELALRNSGLRPFSVWQLFGNGSVGSQALTGIPVVRSLRQHPDLRDRAVVWPFETGLTTAPTAGRDGAIVFAEVWPSSIPLDTTLHPVRDAAQVIGLAAHLADLDRAGLLAARFRPDLDTDTAAVVVDEEGWVLGAGAHHAP